MVSNPEHRNILQHSKEHYLHYSLPLFSYSNAAFSVKNEDFNGYDSSSEEYSDDEPMQKNPKATKTKMKQIDLSPEAVQKRKEVYNKWLQSVK